MKAVESILVILFCLLFVTISVTNVYALPYSSGDIIEFGCYPQTKIIDDKLINELDREQKNWHSYDYYAGQSSSHGTDYMDGSMVQTDFMIYCDVEYPKGSGIYYRGVCFSKYRPYQTNLRNSLNLSYQDDNGYYSGAIYWFKWNTIEWIIVDVDKGLLLCKEIVDAQPFNNVMYFTPGSDSFAYCDMQRTILVSDYSHSSIRTWLSDKWDSKSFYNTAFQNHTIIQDTVLSCSQYDYEVSDRVFLLSDNDIDCAEYKYLFYNKAVRCATGTDYAKCQGLYVGKGEWLFGEPSCWLLRSDSLDNGVCVVEQNDIFTNAFPNTTSFGIRPAIRIDLGKYKSRVIDVEISDISLRYKDTRRIEPKIISEVSDPECSIQYWCESNDWFTINQDGSVIAQREGTVKAWIVVTDKCGNTIHKEFNVTIYYTWWQKIIRIFLLGYLWY